ncbi:uncharacterized protein LOC144652287 isoform X2 [Oculina patagonica]
MDASKIEKTTAEREFQQYLHGYPGEPEWLTALLYGKKTDTKPEVTEMEQMLVSLRIHVRILYEKQKILAKKLENWEHIAENRSGYMEEKDNEIRQMIQQINDLNRQLKVEHLRLNLCLKDAKHTFEKEKLELENEMEKATVLHENEKRRLKKVLFESKQEIFQLKNRLEESVQETANVTENFKNFYEDYLKLEEDLCIIEQHLIPVQKQFQELAKALNMEPEELHYKLDELKKALSKSENAKNLKEVLVMTLVGEDKDEVTPKDSHMASSSGGSSGSASFSDPQVKPGSSSDFEQSDPSCPFSQKFFPEQLDNSVHNEAEKKDKREKGKAVLSKLGFKIPKFPLRKRKTRY